MLRSRGSHRAPPRSGLTLHRAHALAVLGFGLIAFGVAYSAWGTIGGFGCAAAVVAIYASCGAVARVFAQHPDDEPYEDEEPVSAVPWIAPFVMQMPVPVVPRWSTVYYAPRQIAQGDGAELVEEGLTTTAPTMVLTRELEGEPERVAEYSQTELRAYAEGWHDCEVMLNGGDPTDGPQPDPVA